MPSSSNGKRADSVTVSSRFYIDVPPMDALRKLRRFDCGEIIKAFLKCTGFMKTPVMDLLSSDNRDVHHTENPNLCVRLVGIHFL